MEIKTPAGTIVIDKNVDPGAPGCWVVLRPHGTTEEIGLVYIEAKVNEEYRDDGEREDDLHIYTYGDPYREEWTTHNVIKHEDVVKVCDFFDQVRYEVENG